MLDRGSYWAVAHGRLMVAGAFVGTTLHDWFHENGAKEGLRGRGAEAGGVNYIVPGEATVCVDLGPFSIYVCCTPDDLGFGPKASAWR